MLGLRRGLFQPGGSINTIYAPQALHPSSAASRLSPRLLPTKSYFVTRRYALPRKPAFLPPPQRPLPVPSKKEGIYPEVQDALRSADVSTQLRVIMRHMVHPVVILTSSTSANPSDWRAITLSSFCSLSLKPYPLITFNIKMPSACASTIHTRQRFIIHAMLPTPRAADFAARFSQPYVPGGDWRYKQRPNSVDESILQDEMTSSKDPVPIEGPQGPPTLLKDGQSDHIPVCANESTLNLPSIQEEVMFRLYCTPSRNIPVQDHEIWVAKVDSIDYPPHGDLPFGLEPYAPLSLLYGDRHFRETGLHLVDEHCKARRWMRRKMLYEAERREEQKRELLERRVRLSKHRRDRQGMKEDFADEPVDQVDGGGERDRELETGEAVEQDVGSANEWLSVMKKRTKLKKMLPTLPPDIIPLPENPLPKSSRHGDELLKHRESKLVTIKAAEEGAESWDMKLVAKKAAEKGISVEEWMSLMKKGTGSKKMLPNTVPVPDTPHPNSSHGLDNPCGSDTSRRPPINSSSSIRASATPTSSGESQAMSTKTLAKPGIPKKPVVRSFEDWMKKRPGTNSRKFLS